MSRELGGYRIAPARPQDVPPLPAIEMEAAQLFPSELIAPELLTESLGLSFFERAADEGRLFVAVHEESDAPVGFAAMIELGEEAHLYEIDVLPSHGRKGLGAALVEAVVARARECGFPSVTLTTFRDVAWNRPFYERLGFETIEPDDRATMGPTLAAQFDREAADGVDPRTRVAMRLRIPVGPQPMSPRTSA